MKVFQQVELGNGRVEMTQTITLPDRNDVLNLMKIPDPYLVDELKARGYIVSTKTNNDKCHDICTTANHVLNILITSGASLKEFIRTVIMESYSRSNNNQKEAAKILGVSPRVYHYWFHNITDKKEITDGETSHDKVLPMWS